MGYYSAGPGTGSTFYFTLPYTPQKFSAGTARNLATLLSDGDTILTNIGHKADTLLKRTFSRSNFRSPAKRNQIMHFDSDSSESDLGGADLAGAISIYVDRSSKSRSSLPSPASRGLSSTSTVSRKRPSHGNLRSDSINGSYTMSNHEENSYPSGILTLASTVKPTLHNMFTELTMTPEYDEKGEEENCIEGSSQSKDVSNNGNSRAISELLRVTDDSMRKSSNVDSQSGKNRVSVDRNSSGNDNPNDTADGADAAVNGDNYVRALPHPNEHTAESIEEQEELQEGGSLKYLQKPPTNGPLAAAQESDRKSKLVKGSAREAKTGSSKTAVRLDLKPLMLIVDDSGLNRRMLKRSLVQQGFDAEELTDGDEAVETIMKWMQQSKAFIESETKKAQRCSTLRNFLGGSSKVYGPAVDKPEVNPRRKSVFQGIRESLFGREPSYLGRSKSEDASDLEKGFQKPPQINTKDEPYVGGNTSNVSTPASRKNSSALGRIPSSRSQSPSYRAVELRRIIGEETTVSAALSVTKELKKSPKPVYQSRFTPKAIFGKESILDDLEKGESFGEDTITSTSHDENVAVLKPRIYEAILMDYVMERMNGPEAVKHIRDLGYTGVIIGVTGNAWQADLDFFVKQGADAVLTKPLDMGRFLETLEGMTEMIGLLRLLVACLLC